MSGHGFQDLVVWQKSMLLAKTTYKLSQKLPREERYALSDQMRRAAISIPSNIAEGQARLSPKEFVHFLSIAQGSKSELQTQIWLCRDIGYLTDAEITEAMQLLDEVGKMLIVLIRRLSS
ncbi:four helix bundle protein [Planctomycetales bacterium]|nr:four helix bundle protein [Planctomycetales bacterium]GHT02395.1 four helix bundle protein [Planctomycetales bacterium]GHV19046.1 four helix bundle protein [Planctomycetales bacterium]